jgi:sec-independent protein translocase protein TatA
MGTFSIWHWLIVLVVVVLLFGTKKLRNVGGDLGAAIRSFRKGLNDTQDGEAERLEPGAKPADPARLDGEQQKTRGGQ